jgi:hypothetical protein
VVIQRSLLDPREVRDQRCAAWFDQYVLQSFAYQCRIAAVAAGQHQREIRALRDELPSS